MGKAWADGPYKLLTTPRSQLNGKKETEALGFASEMVCVHNSIIRAMNAIVIQAPNIKTPTDISDFTVFTISTLDALKEHHETEETLMFPLIEKHSRAGIMDENVVQHEEFHHGMHELWVHCKQVQLGVADYDGDKVVKMMNGFAPPLMTHLEDEIKTLLELDQYDVPWGPFFTRVTEYAKATSNPYTLIPLILTCDDQTYEGGINAANFPPWPWYMKTMFRWTLFGKHKGAWRFGPCDESGMPRPLAFA